MNAAYLQPAAEILLDGTLLAAASLDGLVEVRIQQRFSMPAMCELFFSLAPNHRELDGGYRPGARLEVRLAGQGRQLFSGEITAIEYFYGAQEQREVVVRGYDLLHRMRRRQRVRAFTGVGLKDIASQLASEAGISEVVNRIAAGTYPYLIQHQQNDLEFLVELAAGSGQYLFMRNNALNILDLTGDPGAAPIDLSYGSNLLEARLEINSDRAAPGVQSYGWEAATLDQHRGIHRRGRSPIMGHTAAPVLSRASNLLLLNQAAADANQAEALARAELDQHAAASACLWGSILGDPGIYPGVRVNVRNVHQRLEGSYVVTSAIHHIDTASGYITEIDTSPPQLPARARNDTTTIGVVTRVDDPSGNARVRAQLPAYDNVETGWMQVVLPGAGDRKGFISLPDIGDNVLVLLAREDPARGLVLGGLYGVRKPPDDGVARNSIERYTWITPGQQKIQLDDSGKVIRLENSDGSYIELAGSGITIAGGSIDFKRV